MTRRFNFRLAFVALALLAGVAQQLAKEHRPSMLRPGLRLCAYVANAGDGTVTVVDLVRLAATSTIAVGPAPSGIRAHPTRKEIWGVSSEAGYVWVIDAPRDALVARIPSAPPPTAGTPPPFPPDFPPDGTPAILAASGSPTL